jgi:sigma-E factor negative regulatory protein RseC
MIKQEATVTSCENEVVWVESQRQSTCGQCQLQKGCGTGLLADHVGKRFSRLAISKPTGIFSPGQTVQLEIAEEALVKGAVLMYLMPLFSLFVFAIIAKTAGFSEGFGIIAGLCGLLFGFWWVKLRLQGSQNTANIKQTIKIGEIKP